LPFGVSEVSQIRDVKIEGIPTRLYIARMATRTAFDSFSGERLEPQRNGMTVPRCHLNHQKCRKAANHATFEISH
jgi:hypothetical protein